MYLTVKAPTFEKLVEFHNYFKRNIRNSTSIIFDTFKFQNLEITFYKNLTIFLKGEISTQLKKQMEILIDKKLYFGTDEVGIGENFGPIIVCGLSFKTIDDKIKIFFSGIKDSKKLNFLEIINYSKLIKESSNIECKILEPNKFNEKYKIINNVKNINALLHYELHKKNTLPAVLDQFVGKNIFKKYINNIDENILNNITFVTKGEEKFLEIACSAIVAKDIYNSWVINYCKKNNIDFEINNKLNIPKLWNDIKNKNIILKNENDFIKKWNK